MAGDEGERSRLAQVLDALKTAWGRGDLPTRAEIAATTGISLSSCNRLIDRLIQASAVRHEPGIARGLKKPLLAVPPGVEWIK